MSALLPPRPLRLRASFVLMSFVVGPLALLLAVWLTFEGVGFHAFLVGAGAAWSGVVLVRRGLVALKVAKQSEELVAELVEVDRTRHRGNRASLSMERRRYWFRVDGKQHTHLAATPKARPLFLDEEHTRALVLRAPSGTILFVTVDLSPFAFTAEEERAVRERIEQLRLVRKLVSDIHTC